MSVPLYSFRARWMPMKNRTGAVGEVRGVWQKRFLFRIYRKGNEGGLVWEMPMVAGVVFIQSCGDTVAIGCHVSVEFSFLTVNPVGNLVADAFAIAQNCAEVEVGVAESLCGRTGVHPVVIHTISAKEHLAVVSAQIVIDAVSTFGLQLQKTRVDELHHIVSAQSWQGAQEAGIVADTVPFACSLSHQ